MRGRDKRIVATHDNGKRIVFGKPAFVNGVRALVYEKNNKVEAYIPVEQFPDQHVKTVLFFTGSRTDRYYYVYVRQGQKERYR